MTLQLMYLRRTIIGRRIVRLDNGYIGMVPWLVRRKDVIMLIKGGRVPLALRPRGNNYELLGDCYIHGIMKGEAFDESQCTPIRII
jgi:hypothetical protein